MEVWAKKLTKVTLWRTALAGLLPANDSLLRCWWLSARHSTSANLDWFVITLSIDIELCIKSNVYISSIYTNLELRAIAG